MKKTRFFGILLSILAAIMMIAGLCACDDGTKDLDDETPQATYELTLSSTLSYTLHVGDEVDFTAYFVIKDQNGTPIPVTGDMLDLSKVDLTAPGSFVVTLTYGGKSVSATFTVEAKQEEGPGTTTPDLDNPGSTTPDPDNPNPDTPDPDNPDPDTPDPGTSDPAKALAAALKEFEDIAKWNFAVTEKDTVEGDTYDNYYEYLGYNVLNRYDEDGETYTDYLGYDAQSNIYSFYYDNGDGTYEIYAEDGEDSFYYEYFVELMYLIDPSALLDFEFTYSDGKYSAKDAVEVGNAMIGEFGEYDDDDNFTPYPWTVFDLYLGADGKVSKIVAVNSNLSLEYTFSKYGTVNFTLPDVGTTPEPDDPDTPVEPDPDTPDDPAQALEDALQVFEDNARWNFAVTVSEVYEGETYEYLYRYFGYNVQNPDDYYGTTYWSFDPSSDTAYYYEQDYDGVYQKYDETSDEFTEAYTYGYLIYPDYLMAEDFTFDGTKYVATDPEGLGDVVLGDYGDATDGEPWANVYLYVSNGRVTKIEGIFGSGDKLTYVFSDYGNVNFTLPDGSSTTPDPDDPIGPVPSGTSVELKDLLSSTELTTGYKSGTYQVDGISITVSNVSVNDKVYVNNTSTNVGFNFLQFKASGSTLTLTGEFNKIVTVMLSKFAYDENSMFTITVGSTKLTIAEHSTSDGFKIGTDTYYLHTVEYAVTTSGPQKITFTNANSFALYAQTITLTAATSGGTEPGGTEPGDDDKTDEAKIDEVLKTLTDRKIFASTVLQSELDGVALTWSTDTKMSNGISFGGNRISVTANPAKDTPIVFTVTAKLNDTTKTKTVTITVSAFDGRTLQDRDLAESEFIGLPSTGDRRVLVIPVQFKDDTVITTAQLGDLEKALNGSETDTGWESVKTYYQQASYDKLHLSFDIQTTYVTKNNASYYERLTLNDRYSVAGSETLLLEALASYEKSLDLTIYDTNGDDYIDSVYLIYSHAVDYSGKSDFYWAYTTYTESTTKFDGLYAGYYFFAGFEFMDENTANDTDPRDETIDGLKINASTYIHETGHLLGLDDYYDSTDDRSCGQGLGGADMMDYTVGDQNVYTKTVLGWLTPTIATETTTITLSPSATTSENAAVLIPIKFNNSYFCEYLMVDLYAATGLNEMHANMTDTYLYDGAQFGVRIYHVSASITDPYSTNYSITDYNNSTTDIPLIKLVEADGGDSTFSRTDGLATANDLWKSGQKLSTEFSSYKGNDGKKVNFDIEILSVSATEAQITITFNN